MTLSAHNSSTTVLLGCLSKTSRSMCSGPLLESLSLGSNGYDRLRPTQARPSINSLPRSPRRFARSSLRTFIGVTSACKRSCSTVSSFPLLGSKRCRDFAWCRISIRQSTHRSRHLPARARKEPCGVPDDILLVLLRRGQPRSSSQPSRGLASGQPLACRSIWDYWTISGYESLWFPRSRSCC